MSDALTSDPAAAIKWLAILTGFVALYFQLRRWESKLSGKMEKIEISQPLTVREEGVIITQETIHPIEKRVCTLENEVRVIRLKMDADKTEILEKIEEWGKSTHNGFRSLERAIGRLEGKP